MSLHSPWLPHLYAHTCIARGPLLEAFLLTIHLVRGMFSSHITGSSYTRIGPLYMHHVLVGLYSFPIWHNPCSTSHHSLDLSHSAMYHLQDFGPQRVHEHVSILVQLMHVYMLCVQFLSTTLSYHTHTHNTIHVALHSLIMMVHTLEFKRKVCPSETELVLCMHTHSISTEQLNRPLILHVFSILYPINCY